MSDGRLRFVLLRHDVPPSFGRASHWDLMLERVPNEPLLTWEVLVDLTTEPTRGITTEVRRLPDHRRIYLDYEGPVSGDRGHVTQAATGWLAWDSCEDHLLAVRLDGPRLHGTLQLRSLQEDRWQMLFTPGA